MNVAPAACSSDLVAAAAGMLDLLERRRDDRPIAAAEIAAAVTVTESPNREWRRRRVREVAQELRDAGHQVCGSNQGYWLARDGGEWAEYLEAVKKAAVFRFVDRRRMAEAATDRACGQMMMFDKQPVDCAFRA